MTKENIIKENKMTKENIINELKEYHDKYRNPNLTSFKLSPIYHLFPNKTLNETKEYEHKWPNPYPHEEKSCVYLILDDEYKIIYIGQSEKVQYRFSSYFTYDKDKKNCKIKGNWKGDPHYIYLIPIENETKFERFSLEQYLIDKVKPIDNTKGK